MANGGFSLEDNPYQEATQRRLSKNDRPVELLGGGEHFDNCPLAFRRQLQRSEERATAQVDNGDMTLPREHLHAQVIRLQLEIDTPAGWRG